MPTTEPIIKVSIQGVAGSFHDMAARCYFAEKDIETIPCETFKDAFDAVKNKKAHMAIAAIENSLGGSLLPNYSLLKNSGLVIAGEIYLRIEQHLMALPGQQLHNITEVRSHPMAIIQCEDFLEPLRTKGVKIIDTSDTAISARWIAENKAPGVAALASEGAAKLYGLEILRYSVETNKRNFTRFLVLGPEDTVEKLKSKDFKANKATLCFTLPHETGSLAKILLILARHNLNLTKIQSAPIIGKEWEYYFYLDLIFHQPEFFTHAVEDIKVFSSKLQVLGVYIAALGPGNQLNIPK
jgi:prephenate dehydratase